MAKNEDTKGKVTPVQAAAPNARSEEFRIPQSAPVPEKKTETAAPALKSLEASLAAQVSSAAPDKPLDAPAAIAMSEPAAQPGPKVVAPKVRPAPKPQIRTKPEALAKPRPVEPVVPAAPVTTHVATKAPVSKVAKTLESASAPSPLSKAAIPGAAPKTAPTKPVFAGLFPHFMLEENNMDMSTNFSGFQGAFTDAQAKAKAAFEKSTSMLGEVSEFTKGNVEAVVESGKILAEGVQGIGSELVAESRTAFETMTGDIKELAAAKSPTDFFKIQGDMVRKNFDNAVAYGSKNSEAMLKLFSDSFAPISGRMTMAMEKARSASF